MQGIGTKVVHVLTNHVRRHRCRLAVGSCVLVVLGYLLTPLVPKPQFEEERTSRIGVGGGGNAEAPKVQLRLLGGTESAPFIREPQVQNSDDSKLTIGSLGQPLSESKAGNRRSAYGYRLARNASLEISPANESLARRDGALLWRSIPARSPLNPCKTDTFPKRPPDNLKESFEWQQISQGATNTYVYSAYYDTRGGRRAVVVIGISSDYMGPGASYACQIWFANSDAAEVTPAVITTHTETHGRRYAPTFYTCAVQYTESRPFAVSLVTTQSRCGSPFNVLSISPHDLSNAPEVNFTVCVTPMNYEFDDFRQLVEMVELNRMFGAQRFVLYNFTTGSHVDPYLHSYAGDGVVVVLPWKLPVVTDVQGSKTEPEIHYFGQLAALNDCLYRNMVRSRFVVMTDLDEIVVPHQHGTWMEMLESLTQGGRASDWQNGIASFHFRNVFFRTDYGQDELYSGDVQVRGLQLRSLLTTTREETTFPHGWRSKHIVNTKAVLLVGVHHIESILDYNRFSVRDVDANTALLHHYRSWAGEEPTRQNSRTDRYMHRFNVTILSRVEAVHAMVAVRFNGTAATLGELTTNQTAKL